MAVSAPDRPKGARDAVGRGGGSVENRYAGNARTVEFQIGVNRIEAIQRELLDLGRSAEVGGLADQPVGAGLVTRRGGAMDALRIPCAQPCDRAGRGVVGQTHIGTC